LRFAPSGLRACRNVCSSSPPRSPTAITALHVARLLPPVQVAVNKGARRLIVLSTGHACVNQAPPVGAVANALHALTLLIARQLVSELEMLGPDIEYFVVPPLCPLVGAPYDFSRTADHIDRTILSTDAWLAQHGLQQRKIPHETRLHSH